MLTGGLLIVIVFDLFVTVLLPSFIVVLQYILAPGSHVLAREAGRGNLIVTGHVAGDSLGFAPFLQALRGRGLEVQTLSGVAG